MTSCALPVDTRWWLGSNRNVISCGLSMMVTHIFKRSSYWGCYPLPLRMLIILQPKNISIQYYNQHWIFRLILKHKCLEMIRILIKLIQIVLRKFVIVIKQTKLFWYSVCNFSLWCSKSAALDCICWWYMCFPCFLLFRMFALICDSFVYLLFLILSCIRGCW